MPPRAGLLETLSHEHADETDEDVWQHLVEFSKPARWSRELTSELAFGLPLKRSKVANALGGGPMLQASSLGDFLDGPSGGDPLKPPTEGPMMIDIPDPSLSASKLQGLPDPDFHDGVPPDDVLTAVGLDREYGIEPTGPDGQVEEYWSVEGPDGHVKAGHQVHHIRNGHVVAHQEAHHDDSHHSSRRHPAESGQQHRHGAAVGTSSSSSRHRVRQPIREVEEEEELKREEEEAIAAAEEDRELEWQNARHRAAMRYRASSPNNGYYGDDPNGPQGPLDADPGPGVPIGGSPEDVDNGEISPQEESNVTPSVLLGGAVAIFAQVYLWSNVFVTLFKAPPPPQTNPDEGVSAPNMADSTDGVPPTPAGGHPGSGGGSSPVAVPPASA